MKHEFTATISEGAIEVPLDVKAVFGEARAPVKMTFCGETYKNRIAVYGGKYILGIWKKVLEQHDLTDGKQLEVVLERDDEPRVIEPPAELVAAFAKNAKAKAGWAAMSYSHQREWAMSIEDAKGADTRARRVAKAIEAMLAKTTAKSKPAAKAKAKSKPTAKTKATSKKAAKAKSTSKKAPAKRVKPSRR